MQLEVKRLAPNAAVPVYAHPGDAGMDLHANEELTLNPGDSGIVRTGIAIALPP